MRLTEEQFGDYTPRQLRVAFEGYRSHEWARTAQLAVWVTGGKGEGGRRLTAFDLLGLGSDGKPKPPRRPMTIEEQAAEVAEIQRMFVDLERKKGGESDGAKRA